MVSEREIEAAKRYLPLATDETIRVALEAAAIARAEANAGEPVAWQHRTRAIRDENLGGHPLLGTSGFKGMDK